jgi:hypothetical protein
MRGVVILLTGWYDADPIISALIALLVFGSSWKLLRDSVNILLEQAPHGINVNEVGEKMVGVEGVEEVHDLHVWTVTSGFPPSRPTCSWARKRTAMPAAATSRRCSTASSASSTPPCRWTTSATTPRRPALAVPFVPSEV